MKKLLTARLILVFTPLVREKFIRVEKTIVSRYLNVLSIHLYK